MTPGVRIPLLNRPVVRDRDDPRLDRHRRNWLIPGFDTAGQARLAAARVLVIGAGGLGSPVLLYLAAAGVGTLGICDSDLVDARNLQRQVLYVPGDVGCPKTQAAVRRLSELDAALRFERFPHATAEFLAAHAAEWDLVMDCTDTFAAKYLVADSCAATGRPLVWGTVVGMRYQVSVFWSRPPAGLPVTGLRRLYPGVPTPGSTATSTEVGVLGPVAGLAGTIMAAEAIKLLTGIGEPLIGRVLVGDAGRGRTDTLTYAK